eukprot:8045590-Alexandrium_andersonii.AAC.1
MYRPRAPQATPTLSLITERRLSLGHLGARGGGNLPPAGSLAPTRNATALEMRPLPQVWQPDWSP